MSQPASRQASTVVAISRGSCPVHVLAAASDQANAPPAGAHRRRRRRCPVLPLLPAADFSSCLAHRGAVRCGARSHSVMSLHAHQLIQPGALGPLGLAPTMGFCPPATARIGSNRAADYACLRQRAHACRAGENEGERRLQVWRSWWGAAPGPGWAARGEREVVACAARARGRLTCEFVRVRELWRISKLLPCCCDRLRCRSTLSSAHRRLALAENEISSDAPSNCLPHTCALLGDGKVC